MAKRGRPKGSGIKYRDAWHKKARERQQRYRDRQKKEKRKKKKG